MNNDNNYYKPKGGSGKTSTAVLLTLALAGDGRRVLAVDTDPQAGLTAFILPDGNGKRGIFDVVIGDTADPVHIDRGGLKFDLIPSDYRLDKVYATMSEHDLDSLKNLPYDYIIIDTPPTVQGISRAAASIADKIIIPADISRATIPPTLYTLKALQTIKKTGAVYIIGKNPDDTRRGFIADTMREFIKDLGNNYGGTIPKSITMQKIVADTRKKWTPARIAAQLKPILQAVKL